MSWEFSSESKLLSHMSASLTELYLCSLSDEDYKYNMQSYYFLVLIEVSFEVIPMNSYLLMHIRRDLTNDLGIGIAYV
jgi:hypothetical protein